MGRELYMVGLTVKDLNKSIEFYRKLGVDVPDEGERPHLEVKMSGGMTFFLDSRAVPREDPQQQAELGSYQRVFEFFLPSMAEVDAKYKEMVDAGYRSYHSPFRTTIGMYFAFIDDPDGNTVLLSAELED